MNVGLVKILRYASIFTVSTHHTRGVHMAARGGFALDTSES